MRTIRRGVFETNSSSTHSITLCSKDEYNKWQNGELFLNDGWRADKKFVTKEEAIQKIKENNPDFDFFNDEELDDLLSDYEYKTCENYGYDYERFSKSYKTENGDEIVAFGYYGSDR